MRSANILVLAAGSFLNLKTLVLKNMHDVSELKIIAGALPSIEGLYVVSLPNLDKISQGIESLHSLKQLWLLGLWISEISGSIAECTKRYSMF
jgi:disease resistance protein RPM1